MTLGSQVIDFIGLYISQKHEDAACVRSDRQNA
jgi:hypothetical protein